MPELCRIPPGGRAFFYNIMTTKFNKDMLYGYNDGIEESVINCNRRLVHYGKTTDKQVSYEANPDYFLGYILGAIDWRDEETTHAK